MHRGRKNDAGLTRRTLLKAAAGSILPLPALSIPFAASASDANLKRVATLTPWIMETLIAIGVPPIAVPEVKRGWSAARLTHLASPPLDLGLLGEPNLELLDQLRLDYIFMDAGLQGPAWKKIMDPIAEVVMGEVYTAQYDALVRATSEALRFGDILECSRGAHLFVDAANTAIDHARTLIPAANRSPAFVVRLIDDRNVMIYCGGSLFHDVLVRLGIPAATSVSNDWGFLTTGIETLASVQDAQILYFNPVAKEAERLFSGLSLWSHLPSVQKGKTTAIPEFYSWGGLPTAMDFAVALGESLSRASAG